MKPKLVQPKEGQSVVIDLGKFTLKDGKEVSATATVRPDEFSKFVKRAAANKHRHSNIGRSAITVVVSEPK